MCFFFSFSFFFFYQLNFVKSTVGSENSVAKNWDLFLRAQEELLIPVISV